MTRSTVRRAAQLGKDAGHTKHALAARINQIIYNNLSSVHDRARLAADPGASHVVESRIVGADRLEAVELDGDPGDALSAQSVQQLGQ